MKKWMIVMMVSASAVCATESSKRRSIGDCGAVGDGVALNTRPIQTAIDQLAAEGGGTVVVPKGIFVSGALFLKPGVNLHLEKDAVIKGSTDMSNYPARRIRIEGHFEEAYTPALVNAEGCDGLRITGEGTLDGSGRPTWDLFWTLRNAAADKKNFKNLSIPRAQLCIINESKNVLVDGITFKDSQFWNLHLYKCRNATVQNARFQVPDDYKQAPSTDGIDVDSCQDVTIKGCYFSVTDDCIAMKGSKGPFAMEDKDSPPVERVRISDCTFKRGGGITLGSEATLVRDIVVEKCRFIGPMALLRLKLRTDTPQRYEDIHYRDITLDNEGGMLISMAPWTQYADLKGQPPPKSTVRNISLANIKGRYGALGSMEGNPGQTEISDIRLENIDVQLTKESFNTKDIKALKLEKVIVNGRPFTLRSKE